jgi:hypothetical protein
MVALSISGVAISLSLLVVPAAPARRRPHICPESIAATQIFITKK